MNNLSWEAYHHRCCESMSHLFSKTLLFANLDGCLFSEGKIQNQSNGKNKSGNTSQTMPPCN